MNTDYYESADDTIISRERALEELYNHGVDIQSDEIRLFDLELGRKESYNAQDVLSWLGY